MLVSVIMPARNAEATILEAIRSVLAQTHQELELLVCDDASSDATGEIVSAVGDPRLSLVRNESKLGPGPTRDRLIDTAKGNFVAVLDADDVYLPRRLERMLQVAPAGDCMVFDDTMECHDTPSGLKEWVRLHGKRFGTPIHGGDVMQCSLADLISARRFLIKPMITLDAIKRLGVTHPPVAYAEDGGFFWTLLARGLPAFYLPEAHYLYRITPGSASSSKGRNDLLADVVEGLLAEDLDPLARAAVAKRAAFLRNLATFKSLSTLPLVQRGLAVPPFMLHNQDIVRSYLRGLPRRVHYHLSRLRHRGMRRLD